MVEEPVVLIFHWFYAQDGDILVTNCAQPPVNPYGPELSLPGVDIPAQQ